MTQINLVITLKISFKKATTILKISSTNILMDTNNSLNKLLTTLKYDELELLENFLLIIFFNLNHHMQWTLSHFLFWLLWRNNCQDFSDNRNFADYPARILVHYCFFHCWNGFVHYQRKDQICKPKSQDRKSGLTGLPNSNWQLV